MTEPARKGKIARLPLVIREEVNRRLLDGEPASKILPWLNTQETVLRVLDDHFAEEPITPQNLSEWRQGGYADWLARREKISHLKELSAYAARLGKAAGGDLTDGSAAVLGGKIFEAIQASGPDDIKRLTESLVALRRTDLEVKKAGQRERQVALAERQYQMRFAEAFLRWHDDERARGIADGKGKAEVKIEALRQIIFYGETGEAGGAGNGETAT
jgi:hypothetical protein